jgi:phosphohistidine phosphatase SixA
MARQPEEYFFIVMRHAQPTLERHSLGPQSTEQINDAAMSLQAFVSTLQSKTGIAYELGIVHYSRDMIPQLTAEALASRLGVLPTANWMHLPPDKAFLAGILKELTPTKIVALVSHQPVVERWLRIAEAASQHDNSYNLLYAAPHFLRMVLKGTRILEFHGIT